MRTILALSLLVALLSACAGDVHLEVPPPVITTQEAPPDPTPTPTPVAPTPRPRPTERRVDVFSHALPSGNPVLYLIFYPSRTLMGNLVSFQRSVSTLVNTLLLQQNAYGDLYVVATWESNLTRTTPYVFGPTTPPEVATQNISRVLDTLSLNDSPTSTTGDPLYSFANTLGRNLNTYRGRVSTHFIYFRDQDFENEIEAQTIANLQSSFRSAMTTRPTSPYRSQIQFVSYLTPSSRCSFASHQSSNFVDRLFSGLGHLWVDLCQYQFDAGANGWSAASRTIAENINRFQARMILTCNPISSISVTARGLTLTPGQDYRYLLVTNEIELLRAGAAQLQVSDRIEVTYDCAI